MSDELEDKPTVPARIKKWFDRLLDNPIGTLIESGVYIFLLGIGVSIAAMFVKNGMEDDSRSLGIVPGQPIY